MIIEVCVRPAESPIWVDNRPLETGVDAEHLGLYGVNERLLRFIAYLAMRRVGGLANGWVSAEELAALVAHPTQRRIYESVELTRPEPSTPSAVRSLFSRRLKSYARSIQDEFNLSESDIPTTQLIQYAPCKFGSRGFIRGSGKTRGPYRLGPAPAQIKIDLAKAQSFWSGRLNWCAPSPSPMEQDGLHDRVKLLVAQGSFAQARSHVSATLTNLLRGTRSHRSWSNDQHRQIAELWELLGNLDMELGQPIAAVKSARIAFKHFALLGHAPGQAHCLSIEGHALGQFKQRKMNNLAIGAIRRAMNLYVDRSRTTRKGPRRGYYIGALAQHLSKAGYCARAAPKLAQAARIMDAAGIDSRLWQLRIAENHLRSGNLKSSAMFFERIDQSDFLGVSRRAAYARIRARFHLQAEEWTEAERWAQIAYRMGVDFKMAYQIRMVHSIVEQLEAR